MTDSLDHLNTRKRLESLDELLQTAGDAVAAAELDAAEKQITANVAVALGTLAATGSVEIRKMRATAECAEVLKDAEIAKAVLRGARAQLEVLQERVRVAQSLESTARGRLP